MLPNLGLVPVNMESFNYRDSRGEGRNLNESPD